MLATGHVQIIPRRTAGGRVRELVLGNVTQQFPRHPSPGAIVVKLRLEVDEKLLQPRVLEGKVPPGAATIVLEVPENGS
jgi:hypothetical protein